MRSKIKKLFTAPLPKTFLIPTFLILAIPFSTFFLVPLANSATQNATQDDTVGATISSTFNWHDLLNSLPNNREGRSNPPTPEDRSATGLFNLFPNPGGGTKESCTFNGVEVASGESVTAYKNAQVKNTKNCRSQERKCTDGTLSGTYAHSSCVSKNTHHVYVAPDGEDANSGLSDDQPVLTLERADAVVNELIADQEQDVVVHIAGGTYYGQFVRWDSTMEDHTVTLQGDPQDRPVFDGQGEDMGWLAVHYRYADSPQKSNLHIRGIQVQDYFRAIHFFGATNQGDKGYVGSNVIEDNKFINIGGKYVPSIDKAFAAVKFKNARNNIVRNNEFKNIINDEPGTEKLMHAVYMVSYSSGNKIKNNSFTAVSGATIDTRDFSNFNVISNNTFDDIHSVFLSYYQHYSPGSVPDHIECPTWGNRVTNNEIGSQYGGSGNASLLLPGGVGIKDYFHPGTNHEEYCATSKHLADNNLDPDNPLHDVDGVQRMIASGNKNIKKEPTRSIFNIFPRTGDRGR